MADPTAPERIPVPPDLFAETIDALERVGCQFWACEGPTLEPVPMVTCFVCAALPQLQRLTPSLEVAHG